MSEPMSSVEIEDVLSSIRRLVSDDFRPAAPPATPVARAGATQAPVQSPAQLAASKLILTPALRIVAEDVARAEPAVEPVPPPAAEPWDDGEVAAFVNVEDDALFDTDPDPDFGWQTTADVVSLTLPADAARRDPMPEIAPAADAPVPESVAGEPAAEIGADASAAASAEASAEFQASVYAEVTSPDWQDAGPEEPAPPGDAAQDDAAMDALWADAAEAEVLRQLAEEGVSAQAAPPGEDDMIYEENLLRDLVRDIIREELQGELGERITRNVRKLVRAEIARAMALRDFD